MFYEKTKLNLLFLKRVLKIGSLYEVLAFRTLGGHKYCGIRKVNNQVSEKDRFNKRVILF